MPEQTVQFIADEDGVVVGGRPYPWAQVSATAVDPKWADWPWIGFRLPLENGWQVGAQWRRWPREDGVVEACGDTANIWSERSGYPVGYIERLIGGEGKNFATAEEFHDLVARTAVRPSPPQYQGEYHD